MGKTIKAIIVKDDNFKTVGFEVSTNAGTIYAHGIVPNGMNYIKEVDAIKYMNIIITLIKKEVELKDAKAFANEWFRVAKENGLQNEPIKFEYNNSKIKQLEQDIEYIINTIK